MRKIVLLALAGACGGASLPCAADAVADVHALGLRTARSGGIPAAGAANTLVVASVAMFDAANAVEGGRYRAYRPQQAPPAGADADAAALGAGCAVLALGFAAQSAAIATACDGLAAALPGTDAARSGRAYGEASGKASMAARQAESPPVANIYRPRTTAGVYVATPLPVGLDMANAKPWALTAPHQFRPAPPPRLDSEMWTRDFGEVKSLGARNSTTRTAEQTETARFWASLGPQQHMDSVPDFPSGGATVTSRARQLALIYMALTDASIAVFDAKNAYEFWRPVTAIRNADEDGNPLTERDPGWTPLIDTPLHQEYPCAHCAITAAIVTVLALDGAQTGSLTLRAADFAGTAKPRTWSTPAAVTEEVANARVWGGVHYRNSTDAGLALGRAVAKQVLDTQLQPVK